MRALMILCLVTAPALAEETPPEEDGFNLMEEGMELVLRGMMAEMEPTLDEMDQALSALEPSLRDLGPKFMSLIGMIDDIGNYDFPVMLPNGDILIRRTVPLVPETTPEPGPNGEIEL